MNQKGLLLKDLLNSLLAHGLVNGLKNVIDAARKLENLPIVFYFIGDGQEKENLKKYAMGLKSVFFDDPIPQNKIPLYLASADAILISLADIELFRYGVSPNKLYDAYVRKTSFNHYSRFNKQ